jgi:hypothetical protein
MTGHGTLGDPAASHNTGADNSKFHQHSPDLKKYQ